MKQNLENIIVSAFNTIDSALMKGAEGALKGYHFVTGRTKEEFAADLAMASAVTGTLGFTMVVYPLGMMSLPFEFLRSNFSVKKYFRMASLEESEGSEAPQIQKFRRELKTDGSIIAAAVTAYPSFLLSYTPKNPITSLAYTGLSLVEASFAFFAAEKYIMRVDSNPQKRLPFWKR